jgi:ribonuclease P protein component
LHGSQTFPKEERLRYGYQFRRLYEHGRRVQGQLAVVFVDVPPAGTTGRTLGVVTSRRVGNAVVRNRARRLMREVYRLHRDRLKANIQIVIVARAAINGRPYREVETALLDQFRAAGAVQEA